MHPEEGTLPKRERRCARKQVRKFFGVCFPNCNLMEFLSVAGAYFYRSGRQEVDHDHSCAKSFEVEVVAYNDMAFAEFFPIV